MKQKLWILLLMILMTFLTPLHAAVQDYEAAYQLYWHGLLVGASLHEVKKIGPNRYSATAQSFPKLKFLPFNDFERREFTINNHQVRPESYVFQTQDHRQILPSHFVSARKQNQPL